jgi:Protein of unknown function (DUF3575)
MKAINQSVILVRICIILTLTLAHHVKYIAQADTLHLNYHYSQIAPHDSTLAKITNWINALNGRQVNLKLVGYYNTADYKKAASLRLDELFLILNRKARSLITIEELEPKRGKTQQRSRVDIVYTFADGNPAPKKENPVVLNPPAIPNAMITRPTKASPKDLITAWLKNRAASQTLKINLTQLALLNLSLQYECAINKKLSFAIGASYFLPRKVKSYFDAFSNERVGDRQVGFISPVISGWSLTPELRIYPFSKQTSGIRTGFYVAPYVRVSQVSMVSKYNEYYEGVTYNLNFTSKFNCMSAGVMLGKQWQVGKRKRVLLDWWIIGIGAGTIAPQLEASATNINMSQETQTDLKNEVEKSIVGFKFLGFKNPQVTTTNRSFTATLSKVPFLSARGLGFSIGYVF